MTRGSNTACSAPALADSVDDRAAQMDASEARTVTDRIKVDVAAIWELIEQAYTRRAWSALGYPSWDDYCAAEFGAARLRLPREDRRDVVLSLRESGLSLRAIASATGLGRGTVERELAPVPIGTPADPDSGELHHEAHIAPVVGLDGKTYQRNPAPTAPAPKPWRKPSNYFDEFSSALCDLEKLVERFSMLVADERYVAHRARLERAWFLDLHSLLQSVITDLGPAV